MGDSNFRVTDGSLKLREVKKTHLINKNGRGYGCQQNRQNPCPYGDDIGEG